MDWYQNFFQLGPIPNDVMTGHYNLYLVLLSYIIASLASYVALDMSTHLRRTTTTLFRITWLTGGAFVMGAGIWSMHFIGMLSFIMPMPMTYDLFWTGLSMVVAIIAAAIAFMFFMIKNPTKLQYALSGLFLGSAIPTMHYTGMAGMEDVKLHYIPSWFILSIVIAIVAASVAVFFAVKSDKGSFYKRAQLKLLSGLIMGFAICGMHYVGMVAAVITPLPGFVTTGFSLDPKLMAIFVTTIIISIMAIAIILSTSKYYITTVLQNEKDFLEVVLNNMRGGVIACDGKGKISVFNKALIDIFGPISHESFASNPEGHYKLYKIKSQEPLETRDYPLLKALGGKYIKDKEILAYDKNGDEKILVADGQPLQNLEGENVGAVIVYNDITQRKHAEMKLKEEMKHRELAQNKLDMLNKQLISAARRAGMAEIATSILHNIGNIMNSVNVSSLSLQEKLSSTKLSGLSEISKLLNDHREDLNKFIKEDPQGQNFVAYISKISDYWEERKHEFVHEIESINKNVQIIKDIIIMQQSLSGAMGLIENTPLNETIEEALKLTHSTFTKANIHIKREFKTEIVLLTDKSKLLQILVNLIRNAYEELLGSDVHHREITIRVTSQPHNFVKIEIADNGKGIKKELLTKIFSYGFTTKKKGHGIGLHTSALTAKELGGTLTAESEGESKGSTFILTLPIQSPKREETLE